MVFAAATLEEQEDTRFEYGVELRLVVFDGDGASVGGLTAGDFVIDDFSKDGMVSDWDPATHCTEESVASAGGSVTVALVMDQSGSIDSTDPTDMRVTAAKEFLASLGAADEVGLITFAGGNPCVQYDVALWGKLTSDFGALSASLDQLVGCEGGDTPLYDACLAGIELVTDEGSNPAKALVVFTDGDDTASSASEQAVIDKARSRGVRVFTIGLSAGVNTAVLSHIAQEAEGAFFFAGNIGTMIGAFRGMNQLLTGSYARYDCTKHLTVTVPPGKKPGYLSTSVEVSLDGENAHAPLHLTFP